MAGNSAEPGRSVASKIIAILQAFTSGGVHSLTEITHLTGLPISTVHRLATELAAGGVLERTSDARYRVGLPLQVIGSRPAQTPATYEWARRAMDDLSAATHSDVRFGFFEDLDVAFMEKVVGQHNLSLFCGAAALPPHATALGKALLAFSPPGMAQAADRIGTGWGHCAHGVPANGHDMDAEHRAARNGVTLPELSRQPAGAHRAW